MVIIHGAHSTIIQHISNATPGNPNQVEAVASSAWLQHYGIIDHQGLIISKDKDLITKIADLIQKNKQWNTPEYQDQ